MPTTLIKTLLPDRYLTPICIVLLLLSTVITAWAAKPLRVGVYDNKPLIFTADDGKAAGLFIDILQALATEEGWQLEFEQGHWDSLFEKVAAGEIDLLPVVAFSSERAKFLDFNDETVMANWAEIYSSHAKHLSSLLDLEGKRVAVKMGDIHFKALKELTQKFNVTCRFIETDGYQTIFEMLDTGYLDIGVVNRMFGRANQKKYKTLISPIIFNPIEVRYAAPKDRHRDLLTILDTKLVQYKNHSDSPYYKALEKWLRLEQENTIPKSVQYLIAVILITLSLLCAISMFLRSQVSRQTKSLVKANSELQQEIEKNRAVTEELQKYARVVETSPDAIALFDTSHKHLLVNRTYRELVGQSRQELETKTLPDVISQPFFNICLDDHTAACLQGEQSHVTGIYERPGETKRHWHIHLAPYTTLDNNVIGYTLDIHDITQMKELEEKLKNAQKMEAIGLLAGGVAHDLNNILSGLVSYPDMLLVERPETDPMYRPLQTIKQSGIRAAAIVSDLLTLARHSVDNKTTINLNHIISELKESPEYTSLLKESSTITVHLTLADDLLNLQGSPVHLSKCLLNLITNSIEAMADGGILSVATENRYIETDFPVPGMPAGEYVLLIVKDTGTGISAEELNHIFEPFYTSKIMGRSGTGLGMTLVWNTVRDHDGHIDIDTRPGQGTTFSLYFPASRKDIIPQVIERINDYQGAGETVLVIDDMEEQRQFATEILEKLKYSVYSAESGEEALALMKRNQYDILVLDMIMPGGMNGRDTFEQAIQIQPKQKAIIASGYSETRNIVDAQQLGAGQYIRKPYTVLSLARAVKEELEKG
ncbi:transporter substrate-binding domain-containing protein [Desulfopila sp. IMCC35008]|uniref:ATP-binding protein n=1 Tax=Desulfopila sp. IMCC35008 TaxID=2653858 RepID=UPI0013D6AA92|nr:transporter substrate-binding domain-containing protein [Desulfopila sp. IMCC35008]